MDLTPKAHPWKGKTDKLDLIKIKSFCSVKIPVKRLRRQATGGEKTLADHESDKRLGPRIYKDPSKLNSDNKNNSIRKSNHSIRKSNNSIRMKRHSLKRIFI